MTVLTEGDLRLVVPDGWRGSRFDGPQHGASHCMKAVDFVLEGQDREWFVELKDPEAPQAEPVSPQDFLSSKLRADLTAKFRDTFLYRWASHQITKPIHYRVVVAIESLTALDLAAQTDAVSRLLPVRAAMPKGWSRALVEDFLFLNLAAWNRNFPAFPISRISEAD